MNEQVMVLMIYINRLIACPFGQYESACLQRYLVSKASELRRQNVPNHP